MSLALARGNDAVRTATGADAAFEAVHADMLRFFPDVATGVGGDADALMRHVGIDPARFSAGEPALGLRPVITLLEHAAAALRCADFGMHLARRQGGGRVFGPMGVVMKNSRTLGEALDYCARHVHACSLAARMRIEPDRDNRRVSVAFELLLDRLRNKCQVVEQALLLANLNAIEITGGRARAREVLFRHQPLSPLRVYRENFGCVVRFDQHADGMVFSEQDARCPIADPDRQLYEMATSFIATHFTRATPPMHARVRGLILQYLGTERCTNERIAAELCLHPRTLHRRLKAEGTSFEVLKDEVRRDLALPYLQQADVKLTRIAERLGYAETSVLSRSCARWFASSPRQLRSRAAISAA